MREQVRRCLYGLALVGVLLGMGFQVAVAEDAGTDVVDYLKEKYRHKYDLLESWSSNVSACGLNQFRWCYWGRLLTIDFEESWAAQEDSIAPRNLRVIRRSNKKIQVSWKPPKEPLEFEVLNYEILRFGSHSDDPVRFVRSANTRSLIDKDAAHYECDEKEPHCEMDYTYRIRAQFKVPKGYKSIFSEFTEPVVRDTWYQK